MPSEAFEKIKENNTLNCLYPYILKILSETPIHAYLLRKLIEKKFGFKPGNVTAYKVLYDLKRQGLVKKTQSDRTKVYSITPKGRAEMRKVVEFYRKQIKLLG